MKTIYSTIIAFIAVTMFYSCNNEIIPVENITENDPQIFRSFVKEDSRGAIAKQFSAFLSVKNHNTKSKAIDLDLDNIIVSEENGIYVYMIPTTENSDILFGGYSFDGKLIAHFFSFKKEGDKYSLIDENDRQIVDVRLTDNTSEILLDSIHLNPTKASGSEWCGLGVGAAGALAGAFIPFTGGLSMVGYGVCFGVITALVCR